MQKQKLSRISRTLCFATALGVCGVQITYPGPAEAFEFKKAARQFKRDFGKAGKSINKTLKKAGKGLNNNGGAGQIALGLGAGLLVGAATDSAAAGILTGLVIIAAPTIFQENFATSYGAEMNWASTVNSNRRRIIVTPGRTVTDNQKKFVSSKVNEDVKDIQSALRALKLYKGKIDGDFGPGTRAGVKEFQRSLGEAEIGALTAEQRHRLFLQAEDEGFSRAGVLDEIDQATAVKLSVPAAKAIPEYRLANLRFEKLTSNFLKSGIISSVGETEMSPDGSIRIHTLTSDGAKGETLGGNVGALVAKTHSLSKDWAQIAFTGPDGGSIILNTRDDFSSPGESVKWIADFNEEIALLTKLTGTSPDEFEDEFEDEEEDLVVDAQPIGQKPQVAAAPEGQGTATGQTGGSPNGSAVSSDADGTIIIAEAQPIEEKPEVAAAAPEGQGTATGETGGSSNGSAASSDADGTIIIADAQASTTNAAPQQISAAPAGPEQSSDAGADLTGFDSVAETCRQAVYVSFKFPGEDDPITHYNITPPDGTIQMDNGDKTAYFTGNCVRGEYQFSYVHVRKGATANDFKDIKRQGTFELASNSEQCSIDLNTPSGSAQVMCF